ncbi:uncharacterized protein [Nicotiana sylvestris]|uniref:uncharacterized protein n=1 Tax=Nicotiana sylvestris TaxID=4096 RepID=UPI00388CA95D
MKHGKSPEQKEFADAFLEHFLPIEVLKAKALEFEKLRQNDMSVNEYYLKFVSLAKYAPKMVRDMRARVRRFMLGFSDDLFTDANIPAQNNDMTITKMVAFFQGNEDRLKEEERLQKEKDREFSKRAKSAENFSHGAAGSQSQTNVDYRGLEYPTCNTCGKKHLSVCHLGTNGCFGCGQQGHFLRDCPSTKQNNGGRQDTEARGDVVTCILTKFTFDVYALIDPGSTLSYVTPYIAKKFGIEPEKLCEPFEVSTLVGELVITRCIYRGCSVKVYHRLTAADLVEVEMVDFDVIMGMDWLASRYATVGCRTKIVSFAFLGEPVLEWEGDAVTPRDRFVSYLKARKMISKGYIYHLNGSSRVERVKSPVENLLDKGFIRPSVSPWGAPVLFVRKKGYYRRFVEGFSSISSPLTRLTQKKVKFQWSDACEKSFEELKKRFTSAPVLTLAEGTEGFVIYCDASGVGLGYVLMQHGKANVVADALSQRSMGNLAHVEAGKRTMMKEVHHLASLGVRLLDSKDGGVVLQNRAETFLVAEVKEKQFNDPYLLQMKEEFTNTRL